MEVYGTKPKKFTKAWWSYFWYYYKWYTIGIALMIFVIVYTCVDCSNQTKYDLIADYISGEPLTSDQEDGLKNIMESVISDASGNGITEANISDLSLGGLMDAQMIQAKQAKITIEPQFGDAFVFFLNKEHVITYSEYDSWEQPDVWTDKEPQDDGFTVSLKGCAVLENLGIDTSDLYITVRKLREDETDRELRKKQYDNAIKFARYLLNQG